MNPVRIILVAAAVSVGLANALFYSTVGNSPWGGPFVWKPDPGPLFAAHMTSALLAALVISGVLIRFAGRELRKGFFSRYRVMVLAVCAGGAVLGVLLDATTVLLDDREPAPAGTTGLLYMMIFPAIFGGAAGVIEGVILGFPLAGMLGLLRGQNRGSGRRDHRETT